MAARKSLEYLLLFSSTRWKLNLLNPSERALFIDTLFEEFREEDKSIVSRMWGYDSAFGTDFSADINYAYKQLHNIRLHFFDNDPAQEVTSYATEIFKTLDSLNRKGLKSRAAGIPEEGDFINQRVKDIFEELKVYLDEEKINMIMDYPKTIEEFYIRYGGNGGKTENS